MNTELTFPHLPLYFQFHPCHTPNFYKAYLISAIRTLGQHIWNWIINLSRNSSLEKKNLIFPVSNAIFYLWLFIWGCGLVKFPWTMLTCQLELELPFFVSCLVNHILEVLWAQFPCNVWRLSDSRHHHLAFTFFLPSFPWLSLSLRCRGFIINVLIETVYPIVIYSLYYDQIWISVVVSFYSQKKHLWWKVRAILSCWYKVKHWQWI